MLHPAPTSKIAPHLARGTLEERHEATATKPAYIVMGFHNTDYRLHLLPIGEVDAEIGKRLIGTIRADAKRVDVIGSGGRYVDPVYGRPRHVHGRIVAVDPAANTITVHAGMPVICRLTDARQRAESFEAGQFVGFSVLRGATFEQDRG